jgi:hypothetical protein
MEYPYPSDFPQKSRDRVLAQSIRGASDFERAKPQANRLSEIERLLRNYLLGVFIVFVREAGALGRQGRWVTDRVEAESREFLRWFTVTVGYDKGYDNLGNRLAEMVSNWGGILPKVQRAFEQSPEWKEYEIPRFNPPNQGRIEVHRHSSVPCFCLAPHGHKQQWPAFQREPSSHRGEN